MSFNNLPVSKKKLFLLAVIAFSLINVGFQLYNYIQLDVKTLKSAEKFSSKGTKEIVDNIDSLLFNIKELTHYAIDDIESWPYFTNQKVLNWCEDQTEKNANIHGVSIALEPFVFGPKDSLYCIYYDKSLHRSLRIDTIYDYTDTTLANAKWYTKVRELQEPFWTKPYYGAGAKILITDYSVPLMRNGSFIGTLTYTMSINNLMAKMYRLSIGKGGYAALINNDGVIITHPDLDLVLTHDLNAVINDEHLSSEILNKREGFVRSFQDQHGVNKSCSYREAANKEWKIICVFSEESLFENNNMIRVALIRLAISSSFFVALVFFFFLLPKGFTAYEKRLYAMVVSLTLVANIAFIWYLNLEFPDHQSDDSSFVIKDESSLKEYLKTENLTRSSLGFVPLVEVPTGIIIEKIKFEDTYNVGLSGRIWQKYPLDLYIEPGIHFPQLSPFAESNFLSKIREQKKEGYTLVEWEFRSTFMFPFDYAKFPFNVKKIQLKITHPVYSKSILFTPDLEGYASIVPKDLPGVTIDKGTGSNYISSRFSIDKYFISGDLDSKAIRETHNIPVLQYEITSQKPFVNALTKQFIPIFLVSLMIYLLLFNVRVSKDHKRTTVGIETISGFLFILVLSHIDFRKTIYSSTITYLETFYFVIYFMIGFIAVNIVLFNLSKEYLTVRNSNHFLKLIYWPFFFFSIFGITLLVFM